MELIDENHLDVKWLSRLGYSKEMSIDALKKYGTRKAALNYLEQLEVSEEKETENDSIMECKSSQDSPKDDNPIDW